MNTLALSFKNLLDQVCKDFPDIKFVPAEAFSWSNHEQTIYYNAASEHPSWSLLHELGHMTHKHEAYNSDNSLIRIEMEAWETAKAIAKQYNIDIDEDHIQDCMDSYRHWQQKRSRCPRCTLAGLELSSGDYRCINCQKTWHVGSDRFCRVYRRTTEE